MEVLWPDGLDGPECVHLRLVEPALLQQRLGEAALNLAQRSPVFERLENPDRLPEQRLGLVVPALRGSHERQ